MLKITATDDWRATHPGAVIGLLELSGVDNTRPSPALEARKRETEMRLRERHGSAGRPELLALPVMAAYAAYYKRFTKTYHVLLQLESIVFKGKGLPTVSPLVDANFVTEVETLVLTAGHDSSRLAEPVVIDASREGDRMVLMNGSSKDIYPGDMVMRDGQGIGCSIIYGQDARSPISAATTHALYVAYAPPGVPLEAVEAQLRGIEAAVRLFAPTAVTEQHRLLSA